MSPWLFGGAAGLTAAGAAMHFLAGQEGVNEPILHLAEQALSGTLGTGLGWAAGILGGVALGASVLELALPRAAKFEGAQYAALESEGLREAITEVRERVAECLTQPERAVSSALDELLRGALLVKASDLHLSPTAQGLVATYRVHGSLYQVALLPAETAPRMATRVKVLAQLDAFARHPQDGRIRHQVGDQRFEARVSTLQADLGERVVLRLVGGTLAVPQLEALGFPDSLRIDLESLLSRPQGMLFVSGPVGSGKTTTLYSALQHIAQTRGKTTSLVSLEDPIELQLPFATQTQMNEKVGMSFSQTLRSVLRQDPNVLMLGEIRDRETAEIAAQAGLTGHMILTTLHVDRAAGTFARMIEMGVEPFVLASTVVGSLAQRLVRTLCTHCRTPTPPTDLELSKLRALGRVPGQAEYLSSPGCEYCEGHGFTGRLPIAELLLMTPELRLAVQNRRPTLELEALGHEQGMPSLVDTGLARAERGETSLAEVLRVVA